MREHSITVAFTADQACTGVQVRVVAFPGETTSGSPLPSDGVLLLDTALTLRAGVPADYVVSVPQAVKRPFCVWCYIVNEETTWRIDPFVASSEEE